MAAGAIGPAWDPDSFDATAWDEDSWGTSPDGGGGEAGTSTEPEVRRRRRIPRVRIRRG